MSGETDRMRLKDKIISNIAKGIKAIQQYQFTRCPGEATVNISNGDWQCHKLCENLDHALLHGLRHSSSSYWAVVKEFTHKEAVKEIERLQNIATDLGRARAWLFMSLNESLLESYMRCLADSEKFLKKYYAKEALLLDQQRMNVLMTLTSGLDFICFQLEYDVPYLDLSTIPPRGHVCPEPMLGRPIEEDRQSLLSTDSLGSRTPATLETSVTMSESPRMATDSDTASVASMEAGGGAGAGGMALALRQCSPSVDSGCSGDVMVSSTSSSSSKRQSVADTASVSSLEAELRETRIQRIESITSDTQMEGPEDSSSLEVIRIKSKATGKLRKKKARKPSKQTELPPMGKAKEETRNGLVSRRPMRGETSRREGETSHLGEGMSQTGAEEFQGSRPVPGPSLSQTVHGNDASWRHGESAKSFSQSLESNDQVDFQVGSIDSDRSSLNETLELQKKSSVSQAGPSRMTSEDSFEVRPDGSSCRKEINGVGRGDNSTSPTGKNSFETENRERREQGNEVGCGPEGERGDVKSVSRSYDDSTLEMRRMVDAMQGPVTMGTTAGRGCSPKDSPVPFDLEEDCGTWNRETVTKETEEDDFYSLSFQTSPGWSPRPGSASQLDEYVDFITGSETKPDTLDAAAAAAASSKSPASLLQTEQTPRTASDKSIDVSVDNLKLQLILHVFQDDDDNLIKMFATRMGHTEGDLLTVFVLITDSCLYLVRQKNSDKTFVKEATVSFSELDYVALGLNNQTINLVCTNRRKQYLLTTGDAALTRAIVDCLQAAADFNSGSQKLPVLSDGATQRICLSKSAARDCKCQISEVDIADYSLVFWEDPGVQGNSQSACKEGTLLLRVSDAFRGPSWRPVHVSLRDQILCIFEDSEATKPECFVRLGSEQCAGCRLVALDDREFCIEVILASGPSWELSAASYSEVTDWQQKLCQAVSEGTQEMSGWSCLPCSVLVAGGQLLMYHQDTQTQFHRLLGSASISDITALAADSEIATYIVLDFESQEVGVSSEQWVLYFNDEEERTRFTAGLSKCWAKIFQVELPVIPLDNLPLREHCRVTSVRLEETLKVKR